MLNFSFARRNQVFAEAGADGWKVYHCQPLSLACINELQRSLKTISEVEQLQQNAFDLRFQSHYSGQSQQLGEINDDFDDTTSLNDLVNQLEEPEDLLESDEDAPVIRLLNALFSEAIRANASDIHVESYESRNRIRFRIDGVMQEVMALKKHIAPLLTSRIKVMAKLDIAEKRMPQDGRIALRLGGRSVDLRVSTLPSAQGERVVMRLLDKQAGRLDLSNLGMPKQSQKTLQQMAANPYGIILVTGPTGSGKTTTLYAILGHLNNNEQNIMTVEDPIEYHIDGINQTQINSKINMTFAKGLRAILRQDPDIVMVGEIRDVETASISVQASLTGHLVLSTLHTNTAVGAITRLRDMGVESFLLSSSLTGVVAQRLTRRLCSNCAETYEAKMEQKELLGIDTNKVFTFYRPVGCDTCSGTGYRGRVGIYEVLVVDAQVREYIHENASEQIILQHVRQQYPSLQQEAISALEQGKVSYEEILRVLHTID